MRRGQRTTHNPLTDSQFVPAAEATTTATERTPMNPTVRCDAHRLHLAVVDALANVADHHADRLRQLLDDHGAQVDTDPTDPDRLIICAAGHLVAVVDRAAVEDLGGGA